MSTDHEANQSSSSRSTPAGKGAEPKKTKHESASACEPRNLQLEKTEAWAGSPDDFAVCGEEDPGAGLEFLVADNKKKHGG